MSCNSDILVDNKMNVKFPEKWESKCLQVPTCGHAINLNKNERKRENLLLTERSISLEILNLKPIYSAAVMQLCLG